MPERVVFLLLALGAVSCTSACTFWCESAQGDSYVCCDGSEPYYYPANADEVETPASDLATQEPAGCYYYCGYEGVPYCCGDTSQPIPPNHDAHEGRCAEETEQVCKSSGIFYLTKKTKEAKASGALQLAAQNGKDMLSCASDGYCAEDEKCCPSHCGRKHVCLKSLKSDHEEKNKKEE